MRTLLRFFVFLCVVGGFAMAQQAAPAHFYWSEKKAHELDYNKETLEKNTTLTAEEKSALVTAVTAILQPVMHQEFQDTYDKLPSSAEQARLIHWQVMHTRIFPVDLDGDGVREVIAQPQDYKSGLCGATGNCSFWIFKKSGTAYKLLFDSGQGNGWEMFTIETTRTNGYFDIVLAAHVSASEKFLGLHQVINGKYQQVHCYWVDWINHDHDNQPLKNPNIFSLPCK